MDQIYTKSYLKDFLNKVYISNLSNEQLAHFLSSLVTIKNNHFDDNENNYLIMLILTCVNKTNLTYQNQMLINEILNSLLLDQLVENNSDTEKEDNKTCVKKECPEDISPEDLDLNDNEAVKAYFLAHNKHLENNGNFPYPKKGKTSIITSGDNITIPGVKYMINYIIDYQGNIVGIQGYPKQELSQAEYEDVYSDLIDSIFKD